MSADDGSFVDAAFDDGGGEVEKIAERHSGMLLAFRQWVIEDCAVGCKHRRREIVERRDLGYEIRTLDGMEWCIRWSVEMFVPVEPKRMYESPEFGEKFFEEVGGLVFATWLLDEVKVAMLLCLPVLGEVAVEQMIPANRLLGKE